MAGIDVNPHQLKQPRGEVEAELTKKLVRNSIVFVMSGGGMIPMAWFVGRSLWDVKKSIDTDK